MEIVKMNQYYEVVRNFVNNHEEIEVFEESTILGEHWSKEYLSEDGAIGREINRVVFEQVEVEVKGLKVKVNVKLIETEWFDTDIGKSIYMYQKF